MDNSAQLDWAKFELTKFNASVEAEAKMMGARAEYAYKMMQVLELKVKVEEDQLKLKIHKDAFKSFQRTRHEFLAKEVLAKNRLKEIDKHTRYMLKVALGEHLPPNSVTHVWSGFYFFISTPGIDVATLIQDLEVTSEERDGKKYSHNSIPNEECQSCPETITDAMSLVLFLRRKNYLPKIGTPPYKLIYKVIEALLSDSLDKQAKYSEQIEKVQADLVKIQAADWRTISISPTGS